METSSTTPPTLDQPAIFRSGRGRNLQVVSERTAQAAPQTPDVAAREAAVAAKTAELAAVLATCRAAFAILGARALVIYAALAASAAWGYVLIVEPSYGVVSAALVTAMIFWPALWVDRHPPS